jgi:hypothetical protein
MLLLLPML